MSTREEVLDSDIWFPSATIKANTVYDRMYLWDMDLRLTDMSNRNTVIGQVMALMGARRQDFAGMTVEETTRSLNDRSPTKEFLIRRVGTQKAEDEAEISPQRVVYRVFP